MSVALVISLLLSSILFSVAHHVGPFGDPLRVGVFVYRAMAGLFFACLYQFRGFPIAVYTHALYDIYVMLIH
jgi:membrane protease YdiL (CAAX protease family)